MQEHVLERPGRRIAYRTAGSGEQPLFLLHGWPQTGLCWREVAPALDAKFQVVIPDLRGYGRSTSGPQLEHDKRSVSEDLRDLMRHLGHDAAYVAGHDRGARVAHRWALDHPEEVTRLAVLDVIPGAEMLQHLDAKSATAMWHWFLHVQPGVAETLLPGRLDYYVRRFLAGPASAGHIDEATLDAYVLDYETSAMHGWLQDYRAGFGIDLEHDDQDRVAGRVLEQPVLALWGAAGGLGRRDVLSIWHDYASDVRGRALEGCGHYLPEERPLEVTRALDEFFLD
ncbi:alpha/beta hydrolase [Nocardioides immobilis]|uniref:Alpha/beta hydrolase n=1 Tax=Nocardioides immobilis TaxID=2049295 RepID=A0A417Y8U6_9ACTN|nr:alpha/beta hydrolase [Nocardioides immobilis]RHW29172.1 alpha/beta hydrolase [Nocardioides immobilis]